MRNLLTIPFLIFVLSCDSSEDPVPAEDVAVKNYTSILLSGSWIPSQQVCESIDNLPSYAHCAGCKYTFFKSDCSIEGYCSGGGFADKKGWTITKENNLYFIEIKSQGKFQIVTLTENSLKFEALENDPVASSGYDLVLNKQ